jgi:glycosyltransferase involved in cell wall biosynthesis
MTACTIIARNYLAQARVLAKSFRDHHPDGSFTVLIVDGTSEMADAGNGLFDVLRLDEIGLDPAEVRRMAMIYNVMELSTAVKPWLLRHLLRSSPQVVYFDPDIEIFAPLDDVAELARKHSIVLTPHLTVPMPRDKFRVTETDILRAGVYNLGFIAVGSGCEPFLDWWSERLLRESVSDPERMRFTDQRWIDFVPGLFPHFILRDSTCNVAYWNLYARQVTWTGQRYEVNGRPLRFFHFSGYDPAVPVMLSKHQGSTPRILLSEHSGVARLCGEYVQKLARAGSNSTSRNKYGYAQSPGGLRIDQHMRRIYREALRTHENEDGPAPPNPFEPDHTERFIEWLNEPIVRGAAPEISRYLIAIHDSRTDLQKAFPDATGTDAQALCDWALSYGSSEETIDARLLPRARQDAADRKNVATPQEASADSAPVVTVTGYFYAELGLGEAARLLLTALDSTSARYIAVSCRDTESRQGHPFKEQAVGGVHSDVNIICINADQIPRFARKAGPEFFRDRHTVGIWFWEVEDFPAAHPGFEFVDEIWVASDYIQKTLQKNSPKPVFCFPLPIPVREGTPAISKAELGLPETFVFLFSFDYLSVFERKNPLALIQAFQEAFAPGEGPVLFIKSINGDKDIVNLERTRFAASDRPDIKIVDRYLAAGHHDALMARCDCYVSLHRAEGFGLTMAEAMAWGKPVIGTNYSGNLAFMTDANSFLCPFELRPIGIGVAPYSPETRWAEPDIHEAARLMRHVYENPKEGAARGRRAQQDLRATNSSQAAALFITNRLAEIRRNHTPIKLRRRKETAPIR